MTYNISYNLPLSNYTHCGTVDKFYKHISCQYDFKLNPGGSAKLQQIFFQQIVELCIDCKDYAKYGSFRKYRDYEWYVTLVDK